VPVDDDEAGGDPYMDLKLDPVEQNEFADGFDHFERRANGAFRIVSAGGRVSEEDKRAVALKTVDIAAEPMNHLPAAILEPSHDLAQIFGIDGLREGRRSDEVEKHHGKLAALPVQHHPVSLVA
jgi:hypothetical protein